MNLLITVLGFFLSRLEIVLDNYYVRKYSKIAGCKINYVNQGSGGVRIGNPQNFYIASNSALKSGTFIECQGGVKIGQHFHTGRGLTIFSSNHNYESDESIPYSHDSILKPVIIEDFVWLGSNVTIVPGVTIGEGAVVGAGSVVTRNVPRCAVVGGNPAKVIKYRNIEQFEKLKKEGKFM